MVSSRSIPNRQTIEQLAQQFPEVDIASVETCLAFLDTTAEVYTALETHFARHGLSVGKFTLLMQLFVAGEQGLTPSGFAERAGVTRATITGLLDGLEREKLVQRQPYPGDRRMLTIHLTDKGRELISNLLPEHFCRTTSMMSQLTTAEKKTLIELLGKLRSGSAAMREP
ncbi:MAG: hypothetical protein CLLPBCKN_003303 [Chroococcidiopsis cubana SAG 39.79]|jgi:DNA-binding MarR family transcriptional regulator|uniref:Transcriptional regulator, MarR family n=2 Tax=Chroococcidiopsis TaxID=54298 RepID=K9TUW3_CHRTP|nr:MULTISPECIES: MarR family transcriptional regulator [Chroococcidiopsis]MBE9017806.1 MarR family transcriptional regulator [Chroococcidiopsidales cyanobacterium LEGE 13417]PSB45811.1 MarR family transcriptional regulator [Cyanosarcina cf. burmensis CCALA 770]AFY86642.1 transcriptional regulator, MarR family [Chroococcidiopsis thermalis PCC 7203]MDZ4873907.1 hypothetical protein [Chroococcidiopsis cubana SAG 39.79]PSB63045.1 MarR family transcriptional regulator [Chroococcidiopsis cubana CCAL